MAYVSVPKDLMAVRTKVMFNLTKRQLICFSLGAAFGIAVYVAVKGNMESSKAVSLMILTMFPFFMFAMYEKHGQPLEVILHNMYTVKFATPKVRPYKSQNFYSLLENQHNLNQEVQGIVYKKQGTEKPRKQSNKKQKSQHNTV